MVELQLLPQLPLPVDDDRVRGRLDCPLLPVPGAGTTLRLVSKPLRLRLPHLLLRFKEVCRRLGGLWERSSLLLQNVLNLKVRPQLQLDHIRAQRERLSSPVELPLLPPDCLHG